MILKRERNNAGVATVRMQQTFYAATIGFSTGAAALISGRIGKRNPDRHQ